ncbi:hypothetical protein NIES2104_22310 [Leptolyngbya sp. NIES-2104]|nr:hypothetical protein NIES2104_22310 [Leptolyngbya sp. NIES-2104]
MKRDRKFALPRNRIQGGQATKRGNPQPSQTVTSSETVNPNN